jgi:ADP-heptose:LPS heptosyltransferase/2-polyprenyl-3-methyl-5-hydroxy-6-metoxy-1,4-benzoquinol methylase
MIEKRLATLTEIDQSDWKEFLETLNHFAGEYGLRQYKTFSRIWEYPWLWTKLKPYAEKNLKLLDVGSELSPFPWFLATQGFRVIVSDISTKYWNDWKEIDRKLRKFRKYRPVRLMVSDSQDLLVQTGSIDIYLSISVIEHVPNKVRVIDEAARVLRPGGMLVLTFDVCEPNLGMTFPSWNGRAVSLDEFDKLFLASGWFDSEISKLQWNTADIPDYLNWHRKTAIHHNYVTAGAMIQRLTKNWTASLKSRLLLGTHIKTKQSTIPVKRMIQRVLNRAGKVSDDVVLKLMTSRLFRRKDSLNADTIRTWKEILVIRLDDIGDVVLSSAFFRELRKNAPKSNITLIVKGLTLEVVKNCPYVNRILVFNAKVKTGLSKKFLSAYRFSFKHFRNQRFDAAIVPRFDVDYYGAAGIAYFSEAPLRLSYSEKVNEPKSRLNKNFDQLYTHLFDNGGAKHEVERNLNIIRYAGGSVSDERLELWTNPDEELFATEMLRLHQDKLLIGFGIGAGAPNRIWPIENYVAIANWFIDTFSACILVVGSQKDQAAGEQIRKDCGSNIINLAGLATVGETSAVLKYCKLFIGNDAGPIHLAAAANVPVIEISCHAMTASADHPNSPIRFGPWMASSIVLRPEEPLPPCTSGCVFPVPHCVTRVSAQMILEAVNKHFQNSLSRSTC